MKALKWFVIEADVDGSWIDYTYSYTMGEAVQKALHVWRCGYSPKDRKHRRIEIVLLWAVYDDYEEEWFPLQENDVGFNRELMEGCWVGSYTPSFTFGPDD